MSEADFSLRVRQTINGRDGYCIQTSDRLTPGLPDLYWAAPGGRSGWIELKCAESVGSMASMGLSGAQLGFLRRMYSLDVPGHLLTLSRESLVLVQPATLATIRRRDPLQPGQTVVRQDTKDGLNAILDLILR